MLQLKEIKSLIENSHQVVIFTGAGISTDSGVPDYRSPGGIWQKYEPVYFDQFMSDIHARRRYWKMKKESYEIYKKAKPNSHHLKINDWYKDGHVSGVITQNIDGFHYMAGIDKKDVVEIHGTDRDVMCLSCDFRVLASDIFESDDLEHPPVCPDCEGFLKPATISFGQSLKPEDLRRAHKLIEGSTVFITIGSSLQVQPAASFPLMAKNQGATSIIVNREPTPLDSIADFVFTGEISDFFSSFEKDKC